MIGWGTPEQVAVYLRPLVVPSHTIRTWAQRGQIPVACDARTKRLIVHAASTRRHAEQREVLLTRAS